MSDYDRERSTGGGIIILVVIAGLLALVVGSVDIANDRDTYQQQVIDLEGDRDGETEDFSCEEDEDCWDCETMGNLQCGPEVRHG